MATTRVYTEAEKEAIRTQLMDMVAYYKANPAEFVAKIEAAAKRKSERYKFETERLTMQKNEIINGRLSIR
jgi:hypothetical protein